MVIQPYSRKGLALIVLLSKKASPSKRAILRREMPTLEALG